MHDTLIDDLMIDASIDAGENAPFGSRVLILLQIRSIQVFFTMWEVNARKAICWTGSRAAGPTEAGDFHEERRAGRARVGARKRDSTSHYLSCPLLLSLVHEISSTPFGPSVAHRLGLIDPDLSHIHLLTICFSVYHTLKGEYKHKIIEA